MALARLVGVTSTRARRDQMSIAATMVIRPSLHRISAGVESSSQIAFGAAAPAARFPNAGARRLRWPSGSETAETRRTLPGAACQARSQRCTARNDGDLSCRADNTRRTWDAVR